MSASIVDLTAQRDRALAKADEILAQAERSKRALSQNETDTVRKCTAQAGELNSEIARFQVRQLRSEIAPQQTSIGRFTAAKLPKTFSSAYGDAFCKFVGSAGATAFDTLAPGSDGLGGFAMPTVLGASYEGGSNTGAPTVPLTVVDASEIVPVSAPDSAIRRLARVIPTKTDIRNVQKSAISSATAKSETNPFTVSLPMLNDFTLSAFTVGVQTDVSYELTQDVPTFAAFVGDDISLAVDTLEEQWFVSGTGVGQAQGLIGNIDTGVAAATPDSAGNLLSIEATYNCLATLRSIYLPNASWLMQRSTALEIRLAQRQAGITELVFTRVNNQDYLHGFPVFYSEAMPAIAAGSTPAIFGDFRQGYLIGQRGEASVYVKMLDQVKAVEGLVTILGYRRVDGRVRRSEALKALVLHA